MALKNLFDMVKADRYTADGREELIKAQDEVTEDAKAKPEGSVSPDGKRIKQGGKWVPKKDAKQPGAKQNTAAGGKPDATPETLAKVSHSKLDVARNEMNTTPEEDQMLDYFVTEMHEDGTGLDEIIKRQDGIYERSNGAYPKEEKTYKSLREKIMNHYGEKNESKGSNAETKPAETTTKFETEQENAKYEEGKKGWETVSKERLPDIKKKVEQKIDYYKKYDPYAMLGKRTGLNAQQKKAVEQNMAQAKENLAFFTGQLEGINEQMGASDSAPRVLTGDTRIRVRKA